MRGRLAGQCLVKLPVSTRPYAQLPLATNISVGAIGGAVAVGTPRAARIPRARIGRDAAQIREMQTELSRVRYPFGHAKAEPTLAEFLLPEPFNDADWPAVIAAGE